MEKGLYRPCGGNESEWVDYFLPIPLYQMSYYLFFGYHLSVRTTRNILPDGAKTGFLIKIQFLLRLKKRIPWCVRTEDSYGTALHLIAQLTKICSNIAATRK